MSFYRKTIRTARKEYKCSLCYGIIKVGEKYNDIACNSANDENEIYWGKECMACQSVITEYVNSGHYDSCEGYCEGYIADWWRDEKCYNCRHRYLPCKPDKNCFPPFDQCIERTKYGTCKAGDTCEDMTHYCRCERFEPEGLR